MVRSAGLLVVTIAALVACNATSAPAPSRPNQGVPVGWQVVSRLGTSEVAGVGKSVSGEGFRIALPTHWAVRDLQREQILEKYRNSSDPAIAASFSEAEALKWLDSFRLLATGTTLDTDRLPAELQVRAVWIDAAVTLGKFEHDQRGMYERDLGAVLVRSQRTQLGKQEAQVMQLRFESGSEQMGLTAFLLIRAREVWTLEFYAPADGMDRLYSVFDEIAATFLFI
jgi:hypothetical protein